jgi:hypothetical protein
MALTRYGELRNQLMREGFPSVFAPAVLRDADSNYVPIPVSERLVQCIWYDQRIAAESLRTTDGRAVRVIFPGWWNLEAGPDFRHATLQIGDEPERTGDVEVHLRAEDWFHHGHDRDPAFNDVILHVVLWQAGSERAPKTRAGTGIAQVALQHQLASPLDSLYDEIDLEAYPHNATGHAGRCARVLKGLPEAAVVAMLEAAGDERFAIKTRKFSRWIHRAGAGQAFYEGWMEALGYKANKMAFRTLAQRVPLAELQDVARSASERSAGLRDSVAAVVFGVAGFLPVVSGGDAYTKRLWSRWWKLRPEFQQRILPADVWRLRGVRPANHPHRRLGAAVALLCKHPNLMEKVLGAVESGGDAARFFAQLEDEYWSHHFILGGKLQRRAPRLIGPARAGEILANVLLPFVAAWAAAEGDDALAGRARQQFAALRPAPSNSVLRLAAMQLFDGPAVARKFLRTSRQQQGLMQIFHDFCLNDKSGCTQCQFPELARRWAAR